MQYIKRKSQYTKLHMNNYFSYSVFFFIHFIAFRFPKFLYQICYKLNYVKICYMY